MSGPSEVNQDQNLRVSNDTRLPGDSTTVFDITAKSLDQIGLLNTQKAAQLINQHLNQIGSNDDVVKLTVSDLELKFRRGRLQRTQTWCLVGTDLEVTRPAIELLIQSLGLPPEAPLVDKDREIQISGKGLLRCGITNPHKVARELNTRLAGAEDKNGIVTLRSGENSVEFMLRRNRNNTRSYVISAQPKSIKELQAYCSSLDIVINHPKYNPSTELFISGKELSILNLSGPARIARELNSLLDQRARGADRYDLNVGEDLLSFFRRRAGRSHVGWAIRRTPESIGIFDAACRALGVSGVYPPIDPKLEVPLTAENIAKLGLVNSSGAKRRLLRLLNRTQPSESEVYLEHKGLKVPFLRRINWTHQVWAWNRSKENNVRALFDRITKRERYCPFGSIDEPEVSEKRAATGRALRNYREQNGESGPLSMNFAKGFAFEQLIGVILSLQYSDQIIVPQFCLSSSESKGQFRYGVRIDYRVGNRVFEVKWGKAEENIRETLNRQLPLAEGQGLAYTLISRDPVTSLDTPIHKVSFQQQLEKIGLPKAQTNLNQALVRIESCLRMEYPMGSYALQELSGFFYQTFSQAQNRTGNERINFILERLALAFSPGSECESLASYRDRGPDPLIAYFLDQSGNLRRGQISITQLHKESPELSVHLELPDLFPGHQERDSDLIKLLSDFRVHIENLPHSKLRSLSSTINDCLVTYLNKCLLPDEIDRFISREHGFIEPEKLADWLKEQHQSLLLGYDAKDLLVQYLSILGDIVESVGQRTDKV